MGQRKTKPKESEDFKLAKATLAAFVKGMVADGRVDPTGLNAQELREKCARILRKNPPSKLLR